MSAIFGSKARNAARILFQWREAHHNAASDNAASGNAVQTIWLAAGQTWSVPAPRGAHLLCTQGAIWVTQTNESRDFLLHGTSAFTAHHDGLLVAQTVGEAPACFHFGARPRKGSEFRVCSSQWLSSFWNWKSQVLKPRLKIGW